MASLNDGPASGTAGATGRATGVAGSGSGCTGAASAKAAANAAAAMGATADSGAALPADATGSAGAAGTGTYTVFTSTGAGSKGAPRATYKSTSTAAMVRTTNTGTARTTGTASQENPDKIQASISLPSPKANLAKDINKTPTHDQFCLVAQLCAFLIHDSPDLTQLNDAEKNPVVGIINIPKSSTIRVLHSFGVGTNPIGGYSPIAGKILSLLVDDSSANPPQDMVPPM